MVSLFPGLSVFIFQFELMTIHEKERGTENTYHLNDIIWGFDTTQLTHYTSSLGIPPLGRTPCVAQ